MRISLSLITVLFTLCLSSQIDNHHRVSELLKKGWETHGENPSMSLQIANEALLLFNDSAKYPLQLDSIYRLQAYSFGDMNKRHDALKAHLNRQRVLLKHAPDSKALASSYFETAGVLANQNDKEIALDYYDKCIELSRRIEYKTQLGQAIIEAGNIRSRDTSKIPTIIQSFFEAEKAFSGNPRIEFMRGYVKVQIANLYLKIDDIENAWIQADSAIGFVNTEVYPDYNGLIYQGAGDVLMAAKQNEEAIYLYKQAQQLYEENNKFFYLPGLYNQLSKAFSDRNKDSAYYYLNKYVEINDSVINMQNNEKIAELQAIFKDEQDSIAIENLRVLKEQEENEKKLVESENAKQKQLIWLAVIALIIVAVLSLFLLRFLNVSRRQNKLISLQKDMVEEKSKEIQDSIDYAKRIQEATIPDNIRLRSIFSEAFVIYKPKDKLSGDFYWANKVTTNSGEHLKIFAVGDCTGHGVPGAMISVLGVNYLRLGEKSPDVNSPAQALDYLNEGVRSVLAHGKETVRDGMDIALGAINEREMTLYYSGAKNPIYVVREGELIVLKTDSHAIGFSGNEELIKYSHHQFSLQKNDMIYVLTDGYQDQFGMNNHSDAQAKVKKFKLGRLKKLLAVLARLDVAEQKATLEETFYAWKGEVEQTDDVCIMGIRISGLS